MGLDHVLLELRNIELELIRLSRRIAIAKERKSELKRKKQTLIEAIGGQLDVNIVYAKKYAGVSMRRAVLRCIEGSAVVLTPKEILNQLEVGGFRSNVKSLYNNVYMACVDLAQMGRINETVKENVKAFERIPLECQD